MTPEVQTAALLVVSAICGALGIGADHLRLPTLRRTPRTAADFDAAIAARLAEVAELREQAAKLRAALEIEAAALKEVES